MSNATCRHCSGTRYQYIRQRCALSPNGMRTAVTPCSFCRGTGKAQAIARFVDRKAAASGESVGLK